MKRLVLIDGNAIMHRAYHALPPLTSPDGKPAHVVYGFASMVIKLFHDLKPTHMAVAFDRPGPTFREKLFASYQIQRPKMEDDFIGQISLVHDLVTAFGIPIYEMDGFEADDMIGTIVAQVIPASESGSGEKKTWIPGQARNDKKGEIEQIIIVTGDRDILQLVDDEKVLVFMPTKGLSEGKLYGEKDVVERMGVHPGLIIDLKALMGDSSDNYPGVSGIGPKIATSLLQTYGSVENIYAKIDAVSGATIKAKLISGKESALLGKELATIRTDAPIVFVPSASYVVTLDTPEVRTFLDALHFPSLVKRLEKLVSVTETKAPVRGKVKKSPQHTDQQALF